MISLNYRDARPIYEQIKDELRRLVVTGALREGEKLPSVRSMASALAINPNTIQKAYGELEAEGYLTSLPGKGSFASVPETDVGKERREHLFLRLGEIAEELRYLGEDEQAVVSRIKQTYTAAGGRGLRRGFREKRSGPEKKQDPAKSNEDPS
ncbi:MAG: GntR family transcriptional regulator [Oscillospiraceae bacterium]|nr:GntR family transcriptional regulator [Oscillospiraceae bacterium]